jgi:hypothetical protein
MPRWTQAARLAQCDRIAEQRPWLNSTGPRSTYGKSVSRMNATGSHLRPDEELTFIVVGDYDLSFLGMPIEQIAAFEVCDDLCQRTR